MTINTSYPGVYIEELNSLALSVSNSATAVPVFAVGAEKELSEMRRRLSESIHGWIILTWRVSLIIQIH